MLRGVPRMVSPQRSRPSGCAAARAGAECVNAEGPGPLAWVPHGVGRSAPTVMNTVRG